MSVSITWLSTRAWFQLKSQEKTIHIDPAYFRSDRKPVQAFEEKCDLVLVTHDHGDHCQPATIDALCRADTLIIAPKRCGSKIDRQIRVIQPGEQISSHGVVVKAVFAYNLEDENHHHTIYHRKGTGVGYVITLQDRTIYHAGDTDFIPEMSQMEPIDLAILPIGGEFTMCCEDAVKAVMAIQPKHAIPMHALHTDPQEFKRLVETSSTIQVHPLRVGETYILE